MFELTLWTRVLLHHACRCSLISIMPATLDIPSIRDARMFHLKRWEDICGNAYYQDIEGRVETNSLGQVIITPPPGFLHSRRQFVIARHLETNMKGGQVMTEVAVLTTDGVKGADAAWSSDERIEKSLIADVLTIAPEICVEVLSPSNTLEEIEMKKSLYFSAGAEEVWICDREGVLHFFTREEPTEVMKTSPLCMEMPGSV